MALTRKFLKALGIEDEKVDQIIEAHTEVTDGLKKKITETEEKIEKYDELQKELDKYKKMDGFKEKYEKEHADFEAYKKEISEKETHAMKSKAVKAYFEGKNITGDNLEIAMMAVDGQLDGFELDGEKLKDTSGLDALVSGKLARLVVKKQTNGVNTATPPSNNGSSGAMTKEQIMKIKDASERQKAIAQNLHLFGKG